MAYLDQPPVDETQEQPGQPTGAAGGTIGGTGGTRPTTAQGSGAWTNLQAYTQANVPQAQQMAGQIGQNIEQERARLSENIKQSREAYEGYLKGQGEQSQAKQDWITKVSAGDNPSTPEVETNWYPTQQQAAEKVTGGLYAPETLRGWDAPTAEVQALQSRVAATGTEQGRLNELRRLQGQQATRGEGLLNQMLLQNVPETKAMFEDQLSRPVTPQLQQAYAQVDPKVQTLRDLQQQTAQYIPETLVGAIQALPGDQSGISAAGEDVVREQEARANALRNLLAMYPGAAEQYADYIDPVTYHWLRTGGLKQGPTFGVPGGPLATSPTVSVPTTEQQQISDQQALYGSNLRDLLGG